MAPLHLLVQGKKIWRASGARPCKLTGIKPRFGRHVGWTKVLHICRCRSDRVVRMRYIRTGLRPGGALTSSRKAVAGSLLLMDLVICWLGLFGTVNGSTSHKP